jgi:hypothetical protein
MWKLKRAYSLVAEESSWLIANVLGYRKHDDRIRRVHTEFGAVIFGAASVPEKARPTAYWR